MSSHDPRDQIRGIQEILISDKKRIGFLFGAGTSYATGVDKVCVPAIARMTEIVVESANSASTSFPTAIAEIRAEIGPGFSIESLLSSIEAKRAVLGNGRLNGLDLQGFADLAKVVKTMVVKLVSVHDTLADGDRPKLAHALLANWIQKARRRFPAEIFTTNYDYLFEIALEASGIPYFDGFAGSYEPFFCPEAVEDIHAYPHLVKLWKMHGSLGWTFREFDKAVIRKQSTPDDSILIYPSHLKYSTSKKQPYIGLIDRLCAFLQEDDAVLFTCGYSFGDDHINERIVTSLRRGANAHVFALYFDESKRGNTHVYGLADSENQLRRLATHETGGKLSVYGIRHAIIGGKFGEWRLRVEPRMAESLQVTQFFDEDAAIPLPEAGERKGDERWDGTGRFLLPDFRKLTEFLNELSSPDISKAANSRS